MAINRHTNIDKQNILKNFDFVLLFLTLCAAVFGMVMIMSATAFPFKYVLVQGFALILGLVAIFFLMVVDYEYNRVVLSNQDYSILIYNYSNQYQELLYHIYEIS